MTEVSYNEADVKATWILRQQIHNCEIQQKIDKIYEKMDVCDDVRMRAILARKVRKWKQLMKNFGI